ncbi:MAG: hypothetical protein KAJ19_26400, partial [Gammaproteobacteria bacterium]|nr:hypothetical protein [Gammaproteobacteria bacterium]
FGHSQATPFGQGRKTQDLGAMFGAQSWQPLETLITEVDELGNNTGIFDKLSIQSIAATVTGPAGTLILKTIQHVSDGKIFTLTPGTGRTVEIQTGGNIQVPSTLTLSDTDMVMMQYHADTDTVKIISSGAASSGTTVPAGTVENEHLEWDDSAKTWNAVQAMTFGVTGPFADSGFLRFENNQIIASARNTADDGNLELKLNGANILDVTESANNPVALQLRAQDAVNLDASFSIIQTSDLAGSGGATTIDTLNSPTVSFSANGNVFFTLDNGIPSVKFSENIDLQNRDIINPTIIQGRSDGIAQFAIFFDADDDGDTSIQGTTANLDRINVINNALNGWFWSYDSGKSKASMGIPTPVAAYMDLSDHHMQMNAMTIPPDSDVDNDSMVLFFDTATDPGIYKLKKKSTVGAVTTVDLESGGGGQTPILSDIDYDGFDVFDISNIVFRDTVSAPTTSNTAIWGGPGGHLNFQVIATSDFFNFKFQSDGTLFSIRPGGEIYWDGDDHSIDPQGSSLDFKVGATTDKFIWYVDNVSTPERAMQLEDDLL